LFFFFFLNLFILVESSSYGIGWAYSLVQSGGSWLMGSKEKKSPYAIEKLDKELEKRLSETPGDQIPSNINYSSDELSLKKKDKEELKMLIEKSNLFFFIYFFLSTFITFLF
jgi:hypothetical protein